MGTEAEEEKGRKGKKGRGREEREEEEEEGEGCWLQPAFRKSMCMWCHWASEPHLKGILFIYF